MKETMKKQRFRLPRVGQRILRSVVALMMCFVVYFLRNRQGIPFYSALAVLQCIQPYQNSTVKVAKNRVTGTFVGAVWGLVLLLLESCLFTGGTEREVIMYAVVSVFTGAVIYSTVLLKCQNAAYFSCVVFLSITVNHITDANPYLFVFNRVLDTLIGVGIAFLANMVHLPRQYKRDILFVSGIDDTIIKIDHPLSPYSRVELNRLIDSGAQFTVSTNRTPAAVRETMDGIRLRLPIIAMSGAVLYDMNENTYLAKRELSRVQAKTLMDYLDGQGLHYFTNTITDDLLVIYYDELNNEALDGVYRRCRSSLYRNYVRRSALSYEHVIYLLLIEPNERMKQVYRDLQAQSWAADYRMLLKPADHYPEYSCIKIYHKDATRENMLQELCTMLKAEKTVTFGSIEGKYDVMIRDADRDRMVKEMKHIYEPVALANGVKFQP